MLPPNATEGTLPGNRPLAVHSYLANQGLWDDWFLPLFALFGIREKEGDRPLSSSRWPVDDKARSYVFFFINPNTNRIDFRAVDEFVPPVAAGAG